MTKRQVVVKLDARTTEIVTAHAGPAGYGRVVRDAIAAFADLGNKCRPSLTPAEWRAIAAAVSKAGAREGLGALLVWQRPQLAAHVASLSAAEAHAVQSVIDRLAAREVEGPARAAVITAGGDPAAVPGEPGWRD